MAGNVDVVSTGHAYLECPRWHDGRLWVSDFYTHQVLAIGADGAVELRAEVPGQPSGLGWLPDGRLLVVSMRDARLLRQQPSGELVEHADLSGRSPGHLNDLAVDETGRAYVGNFGFDLMSGAPIRPTTLVRVDPDGSAFVVADKLFFPNGMVLTPDGGTLVVAETFGNRLTAFDVEADGALVNRREWARFGDPLTCDDIPSALGQLAVAPDGICMDAGGAIWVADALANRVIRVGEGGEILDEISTGGLGVYACMLGGTDGRTLYLCAAPSFAEDERRDTRDGQLLSCRVDIAHAGLP